jgi:hypothetical protein
MRDVSNKRKLPISRQASRHKDHAVGWICEHWDVVEEELPAANPAQCDELEQESYAQYWEKMCEIERMLVVRFGGRCKMSEAVGLASQTAKESSIRLPRECRRNKKRLLAWFAEHWSVLEVKITGKRAPEVKPFDRPLEIADLEPGFFNDYQAQDWWDITRKWSTRELGDFEPFDKGFGFL